MLRTMQHLDTIQVDSEATRQFKARSLPFQSPANPDEFLTQRLTFPSDIQPIQVGNLTHLAVTQIDSNSATLFKPQLTSTGTLTFSNKIVFPTLGGAVQLVMHQNGTSNVDGKNGDDLVVVSSAILVTGEGGVVIRVDDPASPTGFSASTITLPGLLSSQGGTLINLVGGNGLSACFTNAADQSAYCYRNQGGGVFNSTPDIVFNTGFNAFGVRAGRMNGDSLDDLAIIVSTEVQIYYQQSNGSFSAPEILPVPPGSRGLVLVDMDNNGLMDVVVARNGSPTLTDSGANVLLQQPGGGFNSTFYAVSNGVLSVTAKDVTGDGFPDGVVPNFRQGTFSILENDGTGLLKPPVTFTIPPIPSDPTLPITPSAATVFDLTNQNDQTVAVAMENGYVAFFRGTPTSLSPSVTPSGSHTLSANFSPGFSPQASLAASSVVPSANNDNNKPPRPRPRPHNTKTPEGRETARPKKTAKPGGARKPEASGASSYAETPDLLDTLVLARVLYKLGRDFYRGIRGLVGGKQQTLNDELQSASDDVVYESGSIGRALLLDAVARSNLVSTTAATSQLLHQLEAEKDSGLCVFDLDQYPGQDSSVHSSRVPAEVSSINLIANEEGELFANCLQTTLHPTECLSVYHAAANSGRYLATKGGIFASGLGKGVSDAAPLPNGDAAHARRWLL